MSIVQNLEQILSARYGRDVRQAIHDSIEEGYNIAVQAEGKATTAQDSAQASANASAQSSASALQSAQLAEQYKNEAFSGTPAGYEALVEKVNSIYKETASQYAIVGTSEGSTLAHTIYGMSKQDGTPTPDSPVEIQSAVANYKCVGKNINSYPYFQTSPTIQNGITFTVNDDGTIIANGTATADAYYTLHARADGRNSLLLPFGRYKGSGCPNLSGVSMRYGVTRNGDGVTLGEDRGNGLVFTINSGDDYYTDKVRMNILIRIASGTTVTNLTFKPMLTLADVTDQTHEPYKAIAVTTDLTLRALEVTSSDDYNLEKDGKYYIADTVDWSEDRGYEITRRIKVEDLGDKTYAYNAPNAYFSATFDGILSRNYLDKVAICDGFTYYARAMANIPSGGFSLENTGNSKLDFKYSLTSDVNEFKASVAGMKVYYILATPTTEPITSQQAQALLSLKTYDEATSITAESDIEPTMVLEYSKDRNTALALTGHNIAHKNALKIAELNTAFMEITAEQEA